MSNIHVLTGDTKNRYTIVVHVATPAGNNAAGVPWSQAIINSGRNTSVMLVGTGPGQIASAELAQITAGTLIESVLLWDDDPALTNAQRVADVTLRSTQLSNETLARYGAELKYFGFAQ